MNTATKLKLLKADLQMLTSANDQYLIQLLTLSKELLKREGIKEEDTTEYNFLEIQYAAYLFRDRALDEASPMPRFLRWGINCLLLQQKGSEE